MHIENDERKCRRHDCRSLKSSLKELRLTRLGETDNNTCLEQGAALGGQMTSARIALNCVRVVARTRVSVAPARAGTSLAIKIRERLVESPALALSSARDLPSKIQIARVRFARTFAEVTRSPVPSSIIGDITGVYHTDSKTTKTLNSTDGATPREPASRIRKARNCTNTMIISCRRNVHKRLFRVG